MTEKICEVAREAAKVILTADRNMKIDTKSGHGNFVTEYDLKVQTLIKSRLKELFPAASFIGEEDISESVLPDGDCFIVDPIDGTCNFMYDYKVSTVSIAMLRDKKVIAGVIVQPYLDEYFTAEAGAGAYLNGRRIHASDRSLSDSLIIFGTSPYYPELCDRTFELAKRLLGIGRDLRRSGSAASDMSWISAGRADLFYELRLSPWDYAAGSLICTEAGAKIVRPDGGPLLFDRKCGVVAGSPDAVDEFLKL